MKENEVIEKLSQYRDQGVIILGPAGRNEQKLRVYANGGDLGRIGITNSEQCELASEDYLKYLKGDYRVTLSELIEESKKKRENARDVSEILCDEKYIECMLKATKQWSFKQKIYRGEKMKRERAIETELIAQQGKIENKNNNLLVYDMEYAIKLPTRKTPKRSKICKPDFIVFDGKNIGIVELKYDADNMTGKNSLSEHFLDFMDFIWNGTNEDRWNIISESISRLECLNHLECLNKEKLLIDKSWDDNIEVLRKWHDSKYEGEFDTSRIWIGFYFVEGPHKQRKNKNKKMIPCKEYVETEIRLQLEDVMRDAREKGHNTQVRYGYWSNDEKIKLILDKEIKIEENGQISIQ